jgi:hypothetical protein
MTHHLLRFTFYVLRSPGLLLFLAGLYAYTSTLAPTVLEGDAALYEYTPYVLGVTYPTGYPLYILLGKLWLTFFPFGEIAWRMNLFSALCSAAALPLIYGAARRLFTLPHAKNQRGEGAAALAAVLVFATLPTFWRWSTEAKIYALNILLYSGVLYTLARALDHQAAGSAAGVETGVETSAGKLNYKTSGSAADIEAGVEALAGKRQALSLRPAKTSIPLPATLQGLRRLPLALPALLLGLQIAVHSTTVLLIPGLLFFAWLNLRQMLFTKKSFMAHCPLLIIPGLLYLYIPLRAEWLIAHYGRFEAIGRGLLADFYHSGLSGLVRYFSAADFTGGVATNWSLVPEQFITVYIPLLIEDLTPLGVGLGLVGAVALAVSQPRRFLPLFLLYAAPIPFVLTYGQGEQSAFLLPSFLIFALCAGYTFIPINQLLNPLVPRPILRVSRITFYILLFTFLLLPQIQYNTLWLNRKWTRAIYEEWADALNHPLEPGSGMLAHWGDLTSFWYMQHAEGLRPDLRGVYPPDEAAVIDWFERGNPNLYIAGPLQGWAAGIQDRYQLIPWGRLVRIAPRQLDPRSLLPPLPQPPEADFDHKLRLLGLDYPAQAVGGSVYPVTLNWQALAELPEQTTISLRLSRDDGIVAQLDERLRSGWFPSETLPAGQHVLSYALLPIPLGTLPGEYRLQLVTYIRASQPLRLPAGQVTLDLGAVQVVSPPPGFQPDLSRYETLSSHNFNGEIELAGYTYTVSRVGQGKGFGLELLWRAAIAPQDNYTLWVEAVDAGGRVLRAVERQPQAGQAPTGSWQPGQFIRDQVDLVVPASAPPGPEALQVRLSWRRPDGSPLPLRRWGLPMGLGLNLAWLEVTEKENRVFAPPPIQHPLDANLENKTRLLGYNTALAAVPGRPNHFQLDRSTCTQGETEDCLLALDFYWQGLSEMALPYQVFFHVVDANGKIVAQRDAAPGRAGKEPTTGWLPGEIVAHPVELPLSPDLAGGQYSIRIGLYLPPNGPRLFILDETGQAVKDFVEVGKIEIVRQ